ncbi:uncharacterized protein LOC115194569 [Salmo trutta]|uniref:uncharacterized protein LOC115194569 n=1 Tax=Salmo trutta TaxID=8032 RepID=UPI0011318DD8|nr:uncharacterized protein LOC115194569 [Salmo trutta]XP_029610223.1 uncharacterized protein LOC115194569 [Salmo trutta]XP_029610224.1 uncharacterized protein LOC115194569 [Salmo trutta]XP_029610226.1 uncharacterized protein LOC115194569 [Salmo trutta]XP_029610227.1 uncharacterized protein LOC115194569 [Salmo trutta]XP_029610228.1 uncharacterized protein LOC115194569 [Salmo trutta]XP_029610229.1 uncharacterized protein LOC115194569 [Salmo trutta]XP_029610230.1 uncharacterized protein LOC1151
MENDTDDYVYHPDEDYYLSDDDHYLPESEDIAVSVLLLLGIFPILPVLGWIILSFYRKRWDRKHASFSFVFLLLADTLQLIVSPFIVETVLTGVPCWHAHWWCITVYSLFSVSRFSGLFFHLMVALEKIVFLRCSRVVIPQVFIIFFFYFCMMCLYTYFTFLVHLRNIYSFFYGVNTFLGVVALCTAAAACVLTLKPFKPLTDKFQCFKVLAVAMFTFMILYVPEFLYWIIQHHRPAWTQGFSHVHYLPCLRPITDCVLCWFVCVDGELPREQQPTDVELNSPILDSSHSVTSPSQNTLEEKDHGEGPPIREDARNQGKIH